MRLYLLLFGLALLLSLVGLVIPAVVIATAAWMYHVVPGMLGSLVSVRPVAALDSSTSS